MLIGFRDNTLGSRLHIWVGVAYMGRNTLDAGDVMGSDMEILVMGKLRRRKGRDKTDQKNINEQKGKAFTRWTRGKMSNHKDGRKLRDAKKTISEGPLSHKSHAQGTSNPGGSAATGHSPSLSPIIADLIKLTPEGIQEHFLIQELIIEYEPEERLIGVRVRLAYDDEPVVDTVQHANNETQVSFQQAGSLMETSTATPTLTLKTLYFNQKEDIAK
ncbi:hypothetical protein R6Q59_001471 [Mikania micrantha]